MHIFLTGDIQVGKSTLIAKTLALLNIKPGGFKTYFDSDRAYPNKSLYISSAAGPRLFRKENAVAHFSEGQPPQVLTEKFDIYGVELLRSARMNSSLIIMDECGSLECNALLFQKEIMDTLDSSIPVLGVIKQESRGWTDRIRNHPEVKLITVTKENRDELPQNIFYLLNSKRWNK